MRNDPEITLEANPGSVEAGRFKAYRDAGVTRISMGMQAMNDEDLRRLGRRHTSAEARSAFDIARTCFERVSFDLIYARQDQTLSDWRKELSMALDLAIDHLSLYQLTIEDGTAFGDRFAKGGLRGLPSDDMSAEMYEITQDLTSAQGMPAYEISNHARLGAESMHNLIYWRGGDYVGIGPGAHGRLSKNGIRWATEAPKAPALWLEMVGKGKPGELPRQVLSAKDHALEYLMMSLRLREGLDLARYTAISQTAINPQAVKHLVDIGMITADSARICATEKGRMVLNAIIRELAED
jgi:oxygen-independent coproporphyrinogen-3 oxidase